MAERGGVLVVSNHFPPHTIGGAEIVAARQARLLRDLGWNVRVFAGHLRDIRGNSAPTMTRDRYESLEIVRLHDVYRHAGTNFRSVINAGLFADVLKEFGPEIVHFHNVIDLGANLIPLAKRHSKKVIVTLHDYWGFCFKNTILRSDSSICRDFEGCHKCLRKIETTDGVMPLRLRRDYVMSCLDHADFFIAPSRRLAANYVRAGLEAERIHTISNGVDLGAIAPRLRGPPTVVRFLLSSSYLGAHKGITQLVAGLKLLWSKPALRGRWNIAIAGDGDHTPFLREQIAGSGLASVVTLLGRIPRADLIMRLSSADVVMNTSIWPENEPVSLLEGLASGAALIASDVGGAADIVRHGHNGLLYEANDPAALAAAMEQLIVAPRQIQEFSHDNLRRRSDNDETRAGARIDALYRKPTTTRTLPAPLVVLTSRVAARMARGLIMRAPARWGKRRIRFVVSSWASEIAAAQPTSSQTPKEWEAHRGSRELTTATLGVDPPLQPANERSPGRSKDINVRRAGHQLADHDA